MPEQHEQYPLLSDVSRPELYEDNWLSHQEAAITQLVNSLFETSEEFERHKVSSNSDLTKSCSIYHEPPFPVLHKRVQASLLYGALSIPKGITANASRLEGDIGLRRSF
jgi:abnormal spindle-like microcephaly-associated protein